MDSKPKEATKEHCAYCFDVLLAHLKGLPQPGYPPSLAQFEAPLFVTWKKNGDLRGCIGTFQSSSISQSLPEFAITSAINDHRFPPIKEKEVQDLSCAVSFLVNFEKGKDAYDWEIGKHGIIIEFNGKFENFVSILII